MQISRKWGLTALLAFALAAPAGAAELDRYVPGEAEQVVIVNVKQLLGSSLVKKHALPHLEAGLKKNKDMQQLLELTGLDPLRDIDTAIIANAGSDGEKVTLIVRGKFDTAKIHTVAEAIAKEKNDLKISKLGDRHLYEGSKDGKTLFFTFVDGTTLLGATSKDLLTTALESKGGKNKALVAALENLDGKQSIVAAGVVPEEVRKILGGLQQGPADDLKKLKSVAGSVHVTAGVAAGLRLSTGDETAAKNLAEFGDMAKGLLAFFAASNKQVAPVVNELLKTLTIKPKQGDVTIDFKVGEEVIDKALKQLPKKDN